ncbi:MAG: DUF4142 domain-containing protein [Armatimonas sp.]
MKHNLALSACVGALVLGTTLTSSRPAAAQDSSFLSEVAQANLAEIQAGELALDRSMNVNVKRVARMLIEDRRTWLRTA